MPATLLPAPACLRLECLSATDDTVRLMLAVKRADARCPQCNAISRRIHSRYHRTLADLPWNGVPVKLKLTIRRFVCDRANCPQRIFAERVPMIAPLRARRTARLTKTIELIGFELGGEAGARVLRDVAMSTSPDTVLRVIRGAALPATGTPRVLGVDDFALRRGRTYGTILIDLERRRRVDLLPDRRAETLAAWLAAHPGVEIMGRDRGGAYAEGGRQGAPAAQQVADPWHILANLRQSLEHVILRHHRVLKQTAATLTEAQQPKQTEQTASRASASEDEHDRAAHTRDQRRAGVRRAQRVARYEDVRRLRADGASLRQISEDLGLARGTVRRFAQADQFPERVVRSAYPSMMDRFDPYLRTRWSEGCQNATQLWRELCAMGYTGGRSNMRERLKRWRQTPARHGRATQQTTPDPLPPPVLPRSPRQMSWLFVLAPESLVDADRAQLRQFCQLTPQGTAVYALAQEFGRLVRTRDRGALEGWLTTAETTSIPELVRFVRGIRRDRAAVDAMLTSRWSNGQTEGQVNRLKLIKRQMFGRAKFDLLRQRVLYVN